MGNFNHEFSVSVSVFPFPVSGETKRNETRSFVPGKLTSVVGVYKRWVVNRQIVISFVKVQPKHTARVVVRRDRRSR